MSGRCVGRFGCVRVGLVYVGYRLRVLYSVLPYCNVYDGVHKYADALPCLQWDQYEISFPAVGGRSAMVTSRVSQYHQHRGRFTCGVSEHRASFALEVREDVYALTIVFCMVLQIQ